MNFTFLKNILVTLVISLFITCTTDEFCAEPTESVANLKFYSRVGRLLNDTNVVGFSVSGIIEYDSLLYDSVSTNSIKLPFSASKTLSSFIFAFSIPDTLFIPDTINNDNEIIASMNDILAQNNPIIKSDLLDSITTDTIPYYYYMYDTVSFFYSHELYFISQSCGFTYHYKIDSLQSTNNVIDSIIINSGLITTSGNENFKVLL